VTILLIIMTVVVCFVVGIHFGMRSARRGKCLEPIKYNTTWMLTVW
jgi:uncharacterized protein YneF (UPF0154 family)